jgi:hypothetical protein
MERIKEKNVKEVIEEIIKEGLIKEYRIAKEREHFAVAIVNTGNRKGVIYLINGSDGAVEIFIDRDWETDEIKAAEMNWASLGSVDTKDAFIFAQLIKEAAEIVDEINNDKESINKIIKEMKEGK